MYYKIINTKSRIYKQLRDIREKELRMEQENKQAIAGKIPYKWSSHLGQPGQQTWNRTTEYTGFMFENPSEICLKIWKEHPQYPGTYIPNTRTKAGRDMRDFLHNLQGHKYKIILEALAITGVYGTFSFPYLEICGSTIILYLDDKHEPQDEELIEITEKEFDTLNNLKQNQDA